MVPSATSPGARCASCRGPDHRDEAPRLCAAHGISLTARPAVPRRPLRDVTLPSGPMPMRLRTDRAGHRGGVGLLRAASPAVGGRGARSGWWCGGRRVRRGRSGCRLFRRRILGRGRLLGCPWAAAAVLPAQAPARVRPASATTATTSVARDGRASICSSPAVRGGRGVGSGGGAAGIPAARTSSRCTWP